MANSRDMQPNIVQMDGKVKDILFYPSKKQRLRAVPMISTHVLKVNTQQLNA